MELEKILADLVLNDPENRLAKDVALSPELAGMPFFGAPLVCVGDAHDPLFAAQRQPEAVGPWFRLPTEWLPEAKTVISVFFPYTDDVKSRENAREEAPSPAWLHARIEGNTFMFKVMDGLKDYLTAQGYKAVIPTREKEFMSVWGPGSNEKFADPAAFYSSVWSERHVGFVCGMGTFGLSGGLITEKGVCGRLSSLVTDAPLPVTKRAYTQVYEYCTRCGACAAQCPANAISLESGKCHAPCGDRLNQTKVLYAPRYGCGKCQVDVPCMSRRPGV